jgi:uncharacterized membrane protein
MKKSATFFLARTAIITALYVALSLLVMPLSFGFIQVRISEGLTLLALIMPESIPGLYLGCIISNLVGGCAPLDIIFGSLVTLVAAVLTFLSGKIIKKTWLKILVGGIFPVLLNALFLPLIWYYCYGKLEFIYIVQAGIIFLGQALAVYLVGTPLYLVVKKYNRLLT